MSQDPFDIIAEALGNTASLSLEQGTIVSRGGKSATVKLRGVDVPGVEFLGEPPKVGNRCWVARSKGRVLGLGGDFVSRSMLTSSTAAPSGQGVAPGHLWFHYPL